LYDKYRYEREIYIFIWYNSYTLLGVYLQHVDTLNYYIKFSCSRYRQHLLTKANYDTGNHPKADTLVAITSKMTVFIFIATTALVIYKAPYPPTIPLYRQCMCVLGGGVSHPS